MMLSRWPSLRIFSSRPIVQQTNCIAMQCTPELSRPFVCSATILSFAQGHLMSDKNSAGGTQAEICNLLGWCTHTGSQFVIHLQGEHDITFCAHHWRQGLRKRGTAPQLRHTVCLHMLLHLTAYSTHQPASYKCICTVFVFSKADIVMCSGLSFS